MGSAGSSTLVSSSPKPVRARGSHSLLLSNFELTNCSVAMVKFTAVVTLTLLKMYLTSGTHGVHICTRHGCSWAAAGRGTSLPLLFRTMYRDGMSNHHASYETAADSSDQNRYWVLHPAADRLRGQPALHDHRSSEIGSHFTSPFS